MNIKELKEILRLVVREEVKKAISEELREILVEAVQIASTPQHSRTLPVRKKVSVKEDFEKSFDSHFQKSEIDPIMDLLQETQHSMSRQDFANVGASDDLQNQPKPEIVSLQENLDSVELSSFARRAEAILDASNKKDRERHAI